MGAIYLQLFEDGLEVSEPASSALLSVKLNAPATSLMITIRGTGSVIMEEVIRREQTVTRDEELLFPVIFRADAQPGGIAVEVKGDFGRGVRSQVQTFSLVGKSRQPMDSSARARADRDTSAPDVVVVPARTTTRQR